MKLTKTSLLTGKVSSMELPVTRLRMLRYSSGVFLQDAFPSLTADQREFVKTGITPEEWQASFPDEDEEVA